MERYWNMTMDERIEDSDRIAVMELHKKLTKKTKPSFWAFIRKFMEGMNDDRRRKE